VQGEFPLTHHPGSLSAGTSFQSKKKEEDGADKKQRGRKFYNAGRTNVNSNTLEQSGERLISIFHGH
jgi:hypothetical protein